MDSPRSIKPALKPRTIALCFLSGFLLSIFLLQWWQQSSYPAVLWWMLAGGCFGALIFTRMRAETAYASFILLGCIVAMLTVMQTTHVPSAESIDTFASEEKREIEGIVVEAPDERERWVQYVVRVESIRMETGAAITAHGLLLVRDWKKWPELRYGDKILVRGKMRKPEPTDDFHYDRYLSRFGIYALMDASIIEKMSDQGGHRLKGFLIDARGVFEGRIAALFHEPHAALLAGLLTGARRTMPEDVREAFERTGLTHITAISGFNITIILALIAGFLFFLPVRMRLLPSIAVVILFTLFVGASASVVRACIMGILGLIAIHIGRQADGRLLLLWAAFLMLLWNPKYLWYDVGFQLSFLAVIGLHELYPFLEPYLRRFPRQLGMREALAATVAAQIAAMPWVVYHFGTLSLISPLANVLVAPLIPFAMLFGFVSVLFSWIWFPLGQIAGFFAWGILTVILSITQTLARFPLSAIALENVALPLIALYYILLVVMLAYRTRQRIPAIVAAQ